MKTKKILFLALMYCAFFIPSAANAYEVTDTAAYKLTADTYLFTIQYEFGYLNADAFLPIAAESRSAQDIDLPNISYQLIDGNGTEVTDGQLASVVLSEATVGNGYYQIREGERESFTMLVIYRASTAMTDTYPQTLMTTQFGHIINKDGDLSYMEVSAEQLEDYQVTLDSSEPVFNAVETNNLPAEK